MTDLPRGEVTIADLYRSLEQIGRDMSSMASDMRVMVAKVDGNSNVIADHEARLRSLEAVRATATGAVLAARVGLAGLAIGAGAIAGWVAALVHR